jgi:glycosyltransferase involved in cell wall biosynthesis
MFKRWMNHLFFDIAIPVLFLPVLVITAAVARIHTNWRRKRRLQPRVVWGPTPIISIKYWSQAVRRFGYKSTTLVYEVYPINSRDDFDLKIDDFPPRILWLRRLKACFVFAWALMKFDIFNFFFDGGFLARTSLAFLECQLIKIAGKKITVIPYGSDIAVAEHLGVFEESMLTSYPNLQNRGSYIRSRVLYLSQWADFIIKNMQVGFLPKFDLMWPNCLAIDTDLWKAEELSSLADGHTGEVVIFHSSNHRLIKGTDALFEAVRQLQEEQLKIRLELFEKRSNEEVREAVLNCDILAEQFIGGYALSAVEGMSAGKPVLSNLSWHSDDFRKNTCLKDCPIVDTSISQIKENLRMLVEDPSLWEKLGLSGRQYVLKYHSLESVGRVWDEIFHHVWWQEPLDLVRAGLADTK